MYLSSILLLVLPALASASCISGTSLYRRADGDFAYDGAKGPLNWGAISSTCATSRTQSPINIAAATFPLLTPPAILNLPVLHAAHLPRPETSLEVTATSSKGTIHLNGTTYHLMQFHFHLPAEHHVDHEFSPAEVHFVFESDAAQLAVLAVQFELSSSEPSSPLTDVCEGSAVRFDDVVKLVRKHGTWGYTGSLTTPPCTEGVRFAVARGRLPISVARFNAMKSVVRFNSRFTQNLAGEENALVQACRTF